MNTMASRNNDHLLKLMAVAMLIIGFGFADTAVIFLCASLITVGELVAFAFSFVLISIGTVFTVWQVRR